jgi:cytochrome c-type biogenesis protein CcmH
VRRFLLIAALLLVHVVPAFAVNPDEILADAAQEHRAREISAQLRCMVCQNQSIDDSNADLARDLRLLVRDRIKDGDSDGQVIDYVVSRYGEFVLLKPRFSAKTMVLWAMPVVLLLIGGVSLFLVMRGRPARRSASILTQDEQARIDDLLKK